MTLEAETAALEAPAPGAIETTADADDADRFVIGGRVYFTRSGLARELKVSERTLSRWESRRVGPPKVKIGQTVLYPEAELPAWLESHLVRPPVRRGGRAA